MTTTRRTLLGAAAWTAPAITIAAAAPSYADSTIPPRIDPGINGWLQIGYPGGWFKKFDATFDSDPTGNDPRTPDGNPFGLYIYDVNLVGGAIADELTAASITLWFRGKVGSWDYGTRSTGANAGGHGRGWSTPTYVSTQTKPDGLTYHGYRFNYTGPFTLQNDGRVWLQDLEVTAEDVASSDATFWVERYIGVNGVMQAFQRRNGARGPLGDGFPASRARTATPATDTATDGAPLVGLA